MLLQRVHLGQISDPLLLFGQQSQFLGQQIAFLGQQLTYLLGECPNTHNLTDGFFCGCNLRRHGPADVTFVDLPIDAACYDTSNVLRSKLAADAATVFNTWTQEMQKFRLQIVELSLELRRGGLDGVDHFRRREVKWRGEKIGEEISEGVFDRFKICETRGTRRFFQIIDAGLKSAQLLNGE